MTNAGLNSMLSPKARNIIAELEAEGYDLTGDTDLFECLNENFKSDYQFPHIVTGRVARIKLSQGYYKITPIGKNTTPLKKVISEASAAVVAEARKAVESAKKDVKKTPIAKGDVAEGDTIETPEPRRKGRKPTVIE